MFTLIFILLGSFVAVVGMPLTALASRKNLELVRSLYCFETRLRFLKHFLIGSSLDLFNGFFGRHFDYRVLSLCPCSLSVFSSICQEGRRSS